MKSQDSQINTQNLSGKVSKISLIDFSAEEVSDNEFQFESAYARMLFAEDTKSTGTVQSNENQYDISKNMDRVITIDKKTNLSNEILKQNILQSNSTLQTITNIENIDQNRISDKKIHFISSKNMNNRWNTKYTEESQSSIPQQLVDLATFSNSTALITTQTKTNQHNQEPITFQTPALKQSWTTNTSSSARWKRVGRIGLGPPKRAERLSSENMDELENSVEVEQENHEQHSSDLKKNNIQTSNQNKENIPQEHNIIKQSQPNIFHVLSNPTSLVEDQQISPKKSKKIQSLLTNPTNNQDTDSIVQNEIHKSILPIYTSKLLLYENSQKNTQTNYSKNTSIKEPNICYLSSILKSEEKKEPTDANNIHSQVNFPPISENNSSLSQKVPVKSKSIIFVNSRPYNRLDLIGRGGSSKVFRVMDQNNKMFALKKVHFDKADKNAIINFKDEIELLKKLSGHERIIKLYDSEINDTKGYLTMILEIGEIDLSHLLAKQHQRPLDINFVRLYWDQMLQAVQAVHDQKIVHSDLKPANFLLVEGSLKLIDFGIAKAIGNDTTNIHRDSQIGTINYMSPEALSEAHSSTSGGQKVMKLGRASDIWSLGCILYQMVYGKTPFAHLTMFQKIKAIPDPKHLIDFPIMTFPVSYNGQNQSDGVKVDKNLIRVMKSCLERDQTKRKTIPDLLQDQFLRPEKHFQSHEPTVKLTLEQMIQLVEQTVEAVKSRKYSMDQLRIATSDSFMKLLKMQED